MLADIFSNMPLFISIPVFIGFAIVVISTIKEAKAKAAQNRNKPVTGFWSAFCHGFWNPYEKQSKETQDQQESSQLDSDGKSSYDRIDDDIWDDKAE